MYDTTIRKKICASLHAGEPHTHLPQTTWSDTKPSLYQTGHVSIYRTPSINQPSVGFPFVCYSCKFSEPGSLERLGNDGVYHVGCVRAEQAVGQLGVHTPLADY